MWRLGRHPKSGNSRGCQRSRVEILWLQGGHEEQCSYSPPIHFLRESRARERSPFFESPAAYDSSVVVLSLTARRALSVSTTADTFMDSRSLSTPSSASTKSISILKAPLAACRIAASFAVSNTSTHVEASGTQTELATPNLCPIREALIPTFKAARSVAYAHTILLESDKRNSSRLCSRRPLSLNKPVHCSEMAATTASPCPLVKQDCKAILQIAVQISCLR